MSIDLALAATGFEKEKNKRFFSSNVGNFNCFEAGIENVCDFFLQMFKILIGFLAGNENVAPMLEFTNFD